METLFLLLVISLVNGDRIVITNSGPIRGTSAPEKKVEAFLRVPYAEPPVGELRFERPVPKSPWEDTYDANTLPPACVQGISSVAEDRDFEMDEDCLYLNLWVPEGGSDPKPVMVFIHGGAFMFGSSNIKLYDGTVLSEHGDVIVATMNYRVGTLGFFSGPINETEEGSIGMYDQVMAIQWIKDNAIHFGGDPENIVLFGESAGSLSVSLHMVSPLSKHLFKRGILQSGSAIGPMVNDPNNEMLFLRSEIIASKLGCADDNESLKKTPQKVMDCMKRLPAKNFSEADLFVVATSGWLLPRVGNSFLPESPIALYKKNCFKDKDALIGITANEGTLFVALRTPGKFEEAENVDFNDTSAEKIARFATGLREEDFKVFDTYLTRVKAEEEYKYLDAMNEAVGDVLFNCGSVFQADYQSRDTSVYFYLFDYRPPSTVYPKWMGVVHAEELAYVFGNPRYEKFTEDEEDLYKYIMDAWTAFAKTGNPNVQGGTNWPPYTLEDPRYLVIGKNDSVGVRPDNYRCEAWKSVFQYEE